MIRSRGWALLFVAACGGAEPEEYVPEGCDAVYDWRVLAWNERPAGKDEDSTDVLGRLGRTVRFHDLQWTTAFVLENPWLAQLNAWEFALSAHPNRLPVWAESSNPECPPLWVVPLAVDARSLDGSVHLVDSGADDSESWADERELPWQAHVSQWVLRGEKAELNLNVSPGPDDFVGWSATIDAAIGDLAGDDFTDHLEISGGANEYFEAVTLLYLGTRDTNRLTITLGGGVEWKHPGSEVAR